ncbi:MAG: alkaline phosphatase D family protein [Pseudomonadota bacterium]
MGNAILNRRQVIASAAAGGALAACGEAAQDAPAVAFNHGVASGDPLQTRVMIWTRATPLAGPEGAPEGVPQGVSGGDFNVVWRVAEDEAFETVVREGVFPTGPGRDYTVKIDVDRLTPGARYYYQFSVGETRSPVGRTRTWPDGPAEEARFAVVSCSNYPFGYFNVYNAIAKEEDLAAIIHLGDYIYEYGPDGYGGEVGKALGRVVQPPKEITTLADYRLRHAQYKSDEDSQAAHAAHPLIAMWDDHETANNSWRGGAQNHQPETEGDWGDRSKAALQAYFEWMPAREPAAGDRKAYFRSYEFGDLLTFAMLETRLSARMEQLDYRDDIILIEAAFDVSDPEAPRPLTDEAEIAALPPEAVRRLPMLFDVTGDMPQPILDAERLKALDPDNLPEGVAVLPDLARIRKELLEDGAGELLGAGQQDWLKGVLKASKAAAKPWQLIGNQIIMANIEAPNLMEVLSEEEIDAAAASYPPARQWIEFTRFELPYNLDAWDGYAAAREQVYETFLEDAANVVVVTGDTHSAWANELHGASGGETVRTGVEFGTTSVSSPGFGNLVNWSGGDVGKLFETKNPGVVYNNTKDRGFLHLTFRRDEAIAEFRKMDTLLQRDYEQSVDRSFRVRASERPGSEALEPLA